MVSRRTDPTPSGGQATLTALPRIPYSEISVKPISGWLQETNGKRGDIADWSGGKLANSRVGQPGSRSGSGSGSGCLGRPAGFRVDGFPVGFWPGFEGPGLGRLRVQGLRGRRYEGSGVRDSGPPDRAPRGRVQTAARRDQGRAHSSSPGTHRPPDRGPSPRSATTPPAEIGPRPSPKPNDHLPDLSKHIDPPSLKNADASSYNGAEPWRCRTVEMPRSRSGAQPRWHSSNSDQPAP
ncbi:hypothetical protein FB566_1317 [Stackebrandtia endophytica]|uniref:Uncharacterized protein n=1 Tax=Stackebrandtia endophytica TaxID=1496996 RepID=A0A543ATA3_9ACTN|nr:hypothetical protein FB566_1317 [Stackebrandtia endophytica]